ncbi:MAG: TrmO family methyltransferase, partial [Prevotella sp.]|nr:TrmO family methyltransferase [Prevotella sp.]
MNIQPIAYFHSPFTSKFGIPKQSGLVKDIEGNIVFEPEYRSPDALRGLDRYDFLWLIWAFSANPHGATSPLVRP